MIQELISKLMNRDLPGYVSMECRWFFNRPVPDAVKDIFREFPPEVRTDTYWIRNIAGEPKNTDQGIKLREGLFEVKSKVENINVPEIPGKVQKWKKVGVSIPKGIVKEKSWLDVTKRRQLIKFEFKDYLITGRVDNTPSSGCNVELTTFGKPLQNYWTLGFEAYGIDYDLTQILIAAYKKITTEYAELNQVLESGISQSYPEWLSVIKGNDK